jgi:hypothetical protein
VDEYQQQVSATHTQHEREPIVSGAAQAVMFRTIELENLRRIQEIRDKLSGKQHISLNTLLQMLIAERFSEIGLLSPPTTYTIPVDLHRYKKHPDTIYPGNLATQVRITLPRSTNWIENCNTLQKRIDEQLDDMMPLVGIPGEWLLALAGDKTYKAVNRDWLLKSTNTDPRFFILTNLGNLDPILGNFSERLRHPYVIVPLMGGPPLVLSFNTFQGEGHLAVTYDPHVLTPDRITEFCRLFESDWLDTKMTGLDKM